MLPQPSDSTPLPYTTLFRSNEAMREQGIASCGKHFPGYSAATSDAHYQLPRIDRTREELDQNELAVFRQFASNVEDRKSTRLNSSHTVISYAVFCLKKKIKD